MNDPSEQGNLKRDRDALVARCEILRKALRTVKVGCPSAEAQAIEIYGSAWRNEVIDKALAETVD